MSKKVRALIRCNDETEDWFATVTTKALSGKFFKIEAIRSIPPEFAFRAFKTRSVSPFENSVIPCFLKLARKGTLGRVSVIGLSEGGIGPDVVFETQSVSAETQFILFGDGYETGGVAKLVEI